MVTFYCFVNFIRTSFTKAFNCSLDFSKYFYTSLTPLGKQASTSLVQTT